MDTMFNRYKFPPCILDRWVELNSQDKMQWLDMAKERCFVGSSQPYVPIPNRTIELRGELIIDELSFYCAFGEAVNGPGGYFGMSFHGFDDCLFGGFGLELPYTVIWRNSAISKRNLGAQVLADWMAESDDELWREIRESWGSEADTFFDVLVNAMRSVPERCPYKNSTVLVELL